MLCGIDEILKLMESWRYISSANNTTAIREFTQRDYVPYLAYVPKRL